MAGWGQFFGAIGNLLPSRKESMENEISKLKEENAKLAHEEPLSAVSANRIQSNVTRIKLLREKISRIV